MCDGGSVVVGGVGWFFFVNWVDITYRFVPATHYNNNVSAVYT